MWNLTIKPNSPFVLPPPPPCLCYAQVRTNCSDPKKGCPRVWNNVGPVTDNFIADIEEFTLLVDHTFTTVNMGLTYSARNMTGRLAVPNNNQLCFAHFDAVDDSGKATTSAPW